MIFSNDTLNIVSGFWRFLTPFINIVKGVIINSFIFNHINIFLLKLLGHKNL